MDKCELRDVAEKIKNQMIAGECCEAEIINEIEKNPELVNIILPATTNLFVEAVNYNYFEIARKLKNMDQIFICAAGQAYLGAMHSMWQRPLKWHFIG